jgi:Na+/proline symporter
MVVIPLFGTIIQAGVTILGLFGGPLLGLFFLGALCPRVRASAALLGVTLGFVAGIATAFSEPLFAIPISFMWVSFASALVTYVTGDLTSRIAVASRGVEDRRSHQPD